MRLALEIEEQKRNASAEEQEILAKFTGFGASEIARALFRRAEEMFPAGWEELGDKLEQIATREDLASLARSTQYAHYTPELLICAIWRAIERMGFAGGAILEPGCGSGLFFALTPEALADKISLTGVEADATTARIARLLYPSARIRHEDFTKARLPQTYNLIIGNPPYVAAKFMLQKRLSCAAVWPTGGS
jgi:type I restriction-modification system DNA methylase subunit